MRPTLAAGLLLALASSAHSAVRAWRDAATRRINIENDYLACSFLPDHSGSLYNCTDKLNQRPLFRASPAGSVAMSFPRTPGAETAASVDLGFRQEKDQAVVWEDGADRASGLEWSVAFVLRDGSAVLEQHVTLRNPTAVRAPFAWSVKAAVETTTVHAADTNVATAQEPGGGLQAGLFANPEFLLPHQQIRFTEYWMAARHLSGVSFANAEGILNLEGRALQLNVTHAMQGARIRISAGKRQVLDEAANLDPSAVFVRSLPGSGAGVKYRFELIDASGHILMDYTEGAHGAAPSPAFQLAPIPLTEPDFLARGNSDELSSRLSAAEDDYRKGLRQYPRSAQLKKALGRLLVERMRYEEGARQLVDADLPRDAEVSYYLGVAQAALGKEEDARKAWAAAAADVQWGPPALLETAASQARSGHAEVALELAAQTVGKRPVMLDAVRLQVALLRKAGKTDAALDCVRHWPADPFLRLEEIQLGHPDEDLWQYLAAAPERTLGIADEYFHFGLYDGALFVLSHPYTPAPANPLVAYYRGYCLTKLGQSGAADFQLASSLSLQRVFPYGPSAPAVLQTAAKANPADASAHFLLGLLYLNGNRLDDGIRELQSARGLRKDLPGLEPILNEALSAAKKDGAGTATAAAPPPRARPSTPSETAAAQALQRAAVGDGKGAPAMFTVSNFPGEKQSDEVRKAYIEIQLQRLRELARSERCDDAMVGVEKIGDEDKTLPFTLYGFGAFMKGARFQYYLGAVEAQCGDAKAAQRRWARVAKMSAAPGTADFAFPALAAESKTRVQAAAGTVSKLLGAAPPESKGILLYSQGLLLAALGESAKAAAAFQEGTQAPDRNMSQYLNQLAMHDGAGAKAIALQ